MLPQFFRDPNGPFKINEKKLRAAQSSPSRSLSSPRNRVVLVVQPSAGRVEGTQYTPVVEVSPPSSRHSAFRRSSITPLQREVPVVRVAAPQRLLTEERAPRISYAQPQRFGGSPIQTPRASPPVDQNLVASPRPRPSPSLPPSPASVRSEPSPRSASFGIPPPAPDPPSAASSPRTSASSPQTTLRVPSSTRIPSDSRSDPGSHKSSSSHGSSKKHSDRGHSRTYSTSTASTTGSTSSKRSDVRTPATTVSGKSERRGSHLLEEAPKYLPKVRTAEEQIEYCDANGRRINRYRYA